MTPNHYTYYLKTLGVNLKIRPYSFVEALVKLINLGFVEAKIEDIGKQETELTKEGLLAHYGGSLSEKEIDIYPDVVEFYFKATLKGVKEEAKDIYNAYYPD